MNAVEPDRLDREHAQLLVIDIQDKLLPHIHQHERVLAQAERMIRAAEVLRLPITISEQYPVGLGPTAAPLTAATRTATKVEKTTFSCCADAGCRRRIASVLRPQVLLVGIETHVCVQQTALDLLEERMQPIVLADAVGSRREFDFQIALERMRHAGVIVTTVEAAIFRMVHDSAGDLFKRILPLVR